jgi:hypothetical protein
MAKKLVPKFTSEEAKNQANQIIKDAIKSASSSTAKALMSGSASREELISKVMSVLDTTEARTKTYVDTALSIIGRARTLAVAKNSGLVWFRYIGGVIETSRDFCVERNGNYYHTTEIEEWPDTEWDGMIEGTNSQNIFYYCGGWNCRHEFIPVLTSMVSEEDMNRYLKGISESEKIEEFPEEAPVMAQDELDALYNKVDKVLHIQDAGLDEDELLATGLTQNDANVINKYTTSFHKDVNAVENERYDNIRGEGSDTYIQAVRDYSDHLEQSLMKMSYFESKPLYRIEKYSEDRLKKYISGEPISIKSFLSTSHSKASSFFDGKFDKINTKTSTGENRVVKMIIQPKVGASKAKNIEKLSDIPDEYEVVFNRNSKFVLERYDEENLIIYLKEI